MNQRRSATIPTAFFDNLYRENPDPWGFGTSAYERAKYADTLSVLERARYGTALEIGCSIGVFTRLLARRCGRLVAVEPSAPALAQARDACEDLPNVTFGADSVPQDFPPGRFDLIMLSEVLYYLDRPDAETAMGLCCDALTPAGEIVLCHWLGETDYPLTGEEAADLAGDAARSRGWAVRTLRRDAYRLDHLQADAG